MAVGQAVLAGPAGVPALLAVEDRLLDRAEEAGRLHAALLRDVLEMERLHRGLGMPLSTVPQVALLLGCSEWRAGRLLAEALGMAELPGGLVALEDGLLTAEQSWVVVKELAPLAPGQRRAVWQRLRVRRAADVEQGVVRPPARLTELLRRWVVQVDAAAAEERRRGAEAERRVDYRRRDDGLVDLYLLGLRAPDAQAVLHRISAAAEPFGPDPRTADQRRLDAARDLLLGRELREGPRTGCGCRPGASAPCGAQVQVHVTLGAALGLTDEPAELVGHGPVERDLLRDLLRNAPRLSSVLTDEAGVPVSAGRPVRPSPGDPGALRRALLEVVGRPPPALLHPRHPDDHPPDDRSHPPDDRSHPPDDRSHPPDDRSHPPGAYRAGAGLVRLLRARAPRCEWPGCGVPAARCDVEHDLPWPLGPTCSCNTGPCCRRHHRVKQEGWVKRRDAGVAWTSPAGRTWSSPSQHEPPAPLPTAHLSETEVDEELWRLLGRPDDGPEGYELRAQDVAPVADDETWRRLVDGGTRWTLDLDDSDSWRDPEPSTSA